MVKEDMTSSETAPLNQATLCLLVQGDQVLLAMKKRGFGQGKWNGLGGKPKEGESIEDAAIRETIEESTVKPVSLDKVSILDFIFPDKPEWSQQVVVYICREWEGEPQETEEMKPQWFNQNELPFDQMWPDDALWMPPVFLGQLVRARFVLSSEQKLLEQSVEVVSSLD